MRNVWAALVGIITLLSLIESVIIDFQNVTQVNKELISSSNDTSARQAGFGFVKFEGESDHDQNKYGFIQFDTNPSDGDNQQDSPSGPPFEYGLNRPVKFEDGDSGPNNNVVDPSEPIRFEDNGDVANSPNPVTFQDDNSLDQKPVQKKKRRRRRRKPRQQSPAGLQHQPQNYGLQYPAENPGVNPQFGIYQGYGYLQGAGNVYGNPGYPQGQYRPPRRARPPPDALSRIAGALSSVARYDDLQCVPRLLCEAAGGANTPGGAGEGLLAGLQPLLTLLSAYNVVSASPLFVFGRAVILGMTSKGNTATCRYAYSSCPTDPEQLIHYLNNHNGGFFRFFNSPQRPGQQNLQQFYNQLSGTYSQQGVNGQSDNAQNYGYYQPNQGQNGYIQSQYPNYGLYQQNAASYNNYAPNYDSQQQPQYGFAQNVYRHGEEKEIQNRIQNTPGDGLVDNYDDINKYKLLFSDNKYTNNHDADNQAGDPFKFPEHNNQEPDNSYDIRESKVFIFPQQQNNKQYPSYRPQQPAAVPNNDNYNKVNTNYAINKYPNNNYASNVNTNYNYANSKYPIHNYASNNNDGNNYPNNNYASNNYASNNYPSNKYPSSNYASNNYAGNNYPSSNYVSNNYPSNNFASNNYAVNNYPSNNYASNRPSNNNQGVTTVYVIRGNGDPSRPEIINLRPGESLT